MTVKLHVAPESETPFEFFFDGLDLMIGRSYDAGLVIKDPSLSRRHALLFHVDGRLMLEDLGSQNGTSLNGQRLENAVQVQVGDVIKLADTTITVREAKEAEGSPLRMALDGSATEALTESTLYLNAAEFLDQSMSFEVQDESFKSDSDSWRMIERLRLLNEVHQALSTPMTTNELLDIILERAFQHLHAEEGTIFLKDEHAELYAAASRTLPDLNQEVLTSRHLIKEVTQKGMAALVYDAKLDERFTAAESIVASGIRSLVAAPLTTPEGTLGMIVLHSRKRARLFLEADLELLISLASVAALRIRNLKLTEEAAQRTRLEEELALARRIQMTLLPDKLPAVAGYDIYANNRPSSAVSGDYYQVLERTNGECVFLVADVSGKGISASLLTASLEAMSAGPIEDGLPPDEICEKISRMLYRRTPPERYASMILAVLDPDTGTVTYTNAGHNPGLLIRANGEIEELDTTGMPIGMLPKAPPYEAHQFILEPNDLLLLYTDGITEVIDPELDEEYGQARLEALVREHLTTGAEGIAAAIRHDQARFTQNTPIKDDQTLVMVRRQP